MGIDAEIEIKRQARHMEKDGGSGEVLPGLQTPANMTLHLIVRTPAEAFGQHDLRGVVTAAGHHGQLEIFVQAAVV